MNKSFCILPFVQTVIRTDGMISPCCSMGGWADIRENSIVDFWQSKQLHDIKQAMLKDEPLAVCSQCYDSEQQTGKSMRLDGLNQYQISESDSIDDIVRQQDLVSRASPRRVEMHVNNTCNLRCLTCRPQDSSMILAEDQRLGISAHDQRRYSIPEDIMVQRLRQLLDHDLDYLDLRGGESMLVPQSKDFLRDLPNDHGIRTLGLQTNGTILIDRDWREIFKKFQQVHIAVSVDAYDHDNYYIRYPAQWSLIERNFEIMKDIPNVYSCVSCTLSNLNLLVLSKLVDWCHDRGIDFFWSELVNPPHFHYTNLPGDVYDRARESLARFPYFANLSPRSFDLQEWRQFCKIIDRRDQHRGNDIFEILPQLRSHWVGSRSAAYHIKESI